MGTEGRGEGIERLKGGGDIIPRNALPFWGRGGIGFDVFFWDGRVDGRGETLISQFGYRAPSSDPLVVAIHLPPVQIGEMLLDSETNTVLEAESIEAAQAVYARIAARIAADPELGPPLAKAHGVEVGELRFIHIAEAIAAFIRANFGLQDTKFHEFVFGRGALEPEEIEGGLLFYGKAGCSNCHNGAYFSDFQFYAVPFSQAGFGMNGFGIDYGRFNVTMDPEDLRKFRTPPLYNVVKTVPYSHSGSISNLPDAIRAHVDPLAIYDPSSVTGPQRVQLYESMRAWAASPLNGVFLNDSEIDQLVSFIGTLNYESAQPVEETE